MVWDLAHGRTYVRTDVCTGSHVTTKIFEIDGLLNFLRYGAPLARLQRAGARLLLIRVKRSELSCDKIANMRILLKFRDTIVYRAINSLLQ